MKTRFSIFLFMIFSISVYSAEFEVVSFTKDASDLSARKFPRKDINDEDCALIKVRCDIKGLQFDSNMGIAGNIESKDGEYWVYVSPYERIIEVFRDGFTKLTFVSEEIIEPATVYVMVIRIKGEKVVGDNTISETKREETIEKPFECGGTFIDERDQQKYETVQIGEQCWMAENLKFIVKKHSVCYKKEDENCKQYGRLYSWESVLDACPKGWELPSKNDWQLLIKNTGGNYTAGRYLKSKEKWKKDGNGEDKYGFDILPAGFKYNTSFKRLGEKSILWSQTSSNKVVVELRSDSDEIRFPNKYHPLFKFSIRCIRTE